MKPPLASLILVGAAMLLGLLATPAHGATMIVHNFTGGSNDGSYPYGSLTLSGSKLYGMTSYGGGSDGGVLFSMNTDGTGFGVLRSFTGGPNFGGHPEGSLTLFGGKLYGMTTYGGSSGYGEIFRMNVDGTAYGVLRTFAGPDGVSPFGSVTISGSKLYGMTNAGGSSGPGTLFGMNTDGTGFSILHSFAGGTGDGANPFGSLTLIGSKLYGMTQSGGSGGSGVLFSINTNGTGYSLLHAFTNSSGDGGFPTGSLTLSGSTLYGVTTYGGSNGTGALFSIGTNGSGFSLLHSFTGGPGDGVNPNGTLTLSGSMLYGMTLGGGSGNFGTLFGIGINGSGFGLLENFGGALTDGARPFFGDLSLSDDGTKLFGMTSAGGNANAGVVFSRAIVPEPGASALLGLGTFLLSARRRNAQD